MSVRGDADLEGAEALIESEPDVAAQKLQGILSGDPLNAEGYRLLARALDRLERRSDGNGEVRSSVRGPDPVIDRAARALNAGDLETAEIDLRKRLLERPSDVRSLYLMAMLARALDLDREAEKLLRLAVDFAPDFTTARIELAHVLDKRHLPLKASEELDCVLALEPGNQYAMALQASVLGRAGRYADAVRRYERLLELAPDEPGLWSAYGFMLKTMGRADDGLRAMRRATEVAPRSGEAWWNLSNVKTVRFEDSDIASMSTALEQSDLGDHDRFHLHFALGKACEDAGDVAAAFDHYDRGNAIRRRSVNYQPNAVTREVDASLKFFSREFFDERGGGWGDPARDPIFIVGMPRSGSTLIEQILASHPLIEGTKELPDLPIIARELGRGRGNYYRNIAELGSDQACALGEEYLDRARTQRVTDRPHFIDKMPTNWLHVGLIHLILPNAKIIDARRHPLACGFSNFKQLYVEGHMFSYDLEMIGRYYADYVRLMAHFDAVLPGRVHRVIHEQLVEATEGEIRRMLDYLELPFDEACLRFYETKRAIRTPSAEQVRRPISREGVDQWRAFEAWLGPLKEALGPVLDAYPGVPDFPSR